MRDTNTYYNYLDKVLIQSKFKIDLYRNGSNILLKKYPELNKFSNASSIMRDWIVDTDPYNRLQQEQTNFNFQGVK
jgi:hypothetical protein